MFKKRQKISESIGTAFDNLYIYVFNNDVLIDEQFMELADRLIVNRPVIANFENVQGEEEINRAIAFLSGIVYALNGEAHMISGEIYLFASDKALSDGTIYHYLKDFGQNKK